MFLVWFPIVIIISAFAVGLITIVISDLIEFIDIFWLLAFAIAGAIIFALLPLPSYFLSSLYVDKYSLIIKVRIILLLRNNFRSFELPLNGQSIRLISVTQSYIGKKLGYATIIYNNTEKFHLVPLCFINNLLQIKNEIELANSQ